MKILSLRFRNINSLQGEHKIDFENAAFASRGVFAITGPNGSGKTSILDAMTLGLYGETFKFHQPGSHVMTKNTSESLAEVVFALGAEKYLSSWQVKRAHNRADGDVQAPEMRLMRLSDGAELANTPESVCDQLTELSGMNFRAFTRSILLAQGDFAAFLNALDSERLDILETIMGRDKYAEYQRELSQKVAQANELVDKARQELDLMIPPLEANKIEAFEQDLSDFQAQYQELNLEQKQLIEQLGQFEQVKTLNRHIQQQQQQVQRLTTDTDTLKTELAELQRAESALAFKASLTEIEQQERVVQQSRNQVNTLQAEIKQLTLQIGTNPPSDLVLTDKSYAEQQRIIADLMQRISQFGAIRQSEAQLLQALTIQQEEKNVVLSELDAWLSTHTADETLLSHFPATTELQALRTELIEASAKLKSVERFVKQAETGLKNNQTEQNKTDAQQSQLTEQLSQAETDLLNCLDGYELSALTELKSEQQERVQRFQELLNLATTYTKLADQGGGLFSLFKKNNLAVRTVDEITADIEATKTETAREENIKRALEQAIIREGLMKKMAPDRQHLHSGKPCPLCGSIQHPYLTQPPQLTNSKQALIDQQVKLKTLANRAARLQQELRITQKSNENNTAKQNELIQLRSRWLGLCNRLNVVEADLTIDNLKLMQQHLNDETFELNTVNGLLSRYQAQQTAIAKLKTRLEKNAELKQFLQTTAERYANDYQNYSEQQQALTKTVQTLTEAEHELALKVNEQLEQLGEKIPNKGKETAFFDRLNNRRQTYQSYLDKRRYLLDELAVLDAKQQQCKAEIDRANQRMDEHVDTMHIEEQIAFQLQLIDKQQVLQEQQTQLAQQTAQLATLNAQLDQALSQSELKQRDELKQRLAQLDKIPTVQNRLQQRLSELSNANNALSQSQQNLDALQTLLAAGPAQETLQETLHSKREQTEIALLEVQRIEKLLKEQHRLRQHYETALRMYQQQQQLASPILEQAELLKPESGHALRRHVQAQFVAQLLDKTNAILEKISRRYYLRQAPSEHGLALDIEDTYQNNSRRPPKSLSGGESFVVSLALALGLSELASNGKSIDTLFLDEGFGNLDSETLYTVISTLDKLRQQGKSIGIISHVEAVQKRIKAQLQVVKKANGYGELKKAS